MATLQLTISSDDEDTQIINRKSKDGKKIISTSDTEDASSDEEDAINNEFDFGGLLEDDENAVATLLTSTDANDNTWSYKSALKLLEKNDAGSKFKVERTNVASIIAAARSNLKKQSNTEESDPDIVSNEDVSDNSDESDSSTDESDDEEDEDVQTAKSMQVDLLKEREGISNKKTKSSPVVENSDKSGNHGEDDDESHSTSDSDSEDEEARKEAAKAAEYFDTSADVGSNQEVDVFSQLNLSRPLLRGVASIGFVTPTPIQAKVIPVALSGRDICASAQTGSGKTAAFLLPIMERIMQRGGGRVQMQSASGRAKAAAMAATRALILTPTRELAAQCIGMMTAISKFTDLRAALIVGGAKNVNAQAAELRTRPDIVVATPGRLIDHLTNSSGVDLDDLEFLCIDEADRLLDLGFQDEVHEIVKSCPMERQTLLFSATMGTKVDELMKLSLKRPLRIHITDKSKKDASASSGGVEVADRLEQEFVRVRTGNEGINRDAMLLSLLTRTFASRVIVFFDTKADAHRLMVICGLCGIKCAELHGNLTQVQRLEALELFREGSVDVLLATDLASRGLDISSVKSVINYEMPSQVETYVHRIGRTARANRKGTSCTLIGEGRRHLMKEVIRDAEQKRRMSKQETSSTGKISGVIRSRTISSAVVTHFAALIRKLDPHVQEVFAAESVARFDRIAEMEAMKAKNIIEHGDHINSRPQREWFASNKQKISAKEAHALKQQQIAEMAGTGTHRMTRKKRRMREAKEELLEAEAEAREEQEETGQRSKKVLTQSAMKSTAKAHRKQMDANLKEKEGQSVHDEDVERQQQKKMRMEKAKKKRKGAFASDSLGDSSLFEEQKSVYATSRSEKPAPSHYKFDGYDPDKQTGKKKKTKSHHGFKSKSKFKRRK